MKVRAFLSITLASVALLLAGCGGGGGGSPPPTGASVNGAATGGTPPSTGCRGSTGPSPASASGNVAPIVVDGGTDGCALNEPFVSVTVCQPGTTTCKTIDHVLLDTGSAGLRVLASALGTVQLPAVSAPAGATLAECASFASGYSWGPVRRADVAIAGESAGAIPIQVVNDPAYSAVPASCSNKGASMGAGGSANGILGVGVTVQDCGVNCASDPLTGMYYACVDPANCSGTAAPLSAQVVNPATAFPTDNNGIAITLPAVTPPGATTLSGTLTFGIATQGNNALGTATVYTTDPSGQLRTTYNGTQLTGFFDSGSNGNFFHDSSIPVCSSKFYCPTTTLQLQGNVAGLNGAATTIGFTVESISTIAANVSAAPVGGDAFTSGTFDWGLPFFFGRTVYEAFVGASTPAGAGPYVAF